MIVAALLLAIPLAAAADAQKLAPPYEGHPSITVMDHRRGPAKPAPAPKLASKVPPLLARVEAKYAKAKTLYAEFTQVNDSVALNKKTTSTGIIMVSRPSQVRWETLKPDPNILVSDGKTFWFYTPPFDQDERGQLVEKKATEVQSRLANALLSGSFSAAEKDMTIERGKNEYNIYVLVPKSGVAGTVKRAEVELDLADLLIRKVTLEHQGGNRSEITLSKIELGKKLDPKLFHFVPPPNTDRVDDQP